MSEKDARQEKSKLNSCFNKETTKKYNAHFREKYIYSIHKSINKDMIPLVNSLSFGEPHLLKRAERCQYTPSYPNTACRSHISTALKFTFAMMTTMNALKKQGTINHLVLKVTRLNSFLLALLTLTNL